MYDMTIKSCGRSLRNLPRGTLTTTAWSVALIVTVLTVAELVPAPATVLAVGLAIATTVLYARRTNEVSTQAIFMAGVMHERATADSYQLPMAAGETMARVVHLPDQRGRPRPRPKHRT